MAAPEGLKELKDQTIKPTKLIIVVKNGIIERTISNKPTEVILLDRDAPDVDSFSYDFGDKPFQAELEWFEAEENPVMVDELFGKH